MSKQLILNHLKNMTENVRVAIIAIIVPSGSKNHSLFFHNKVTVCLSKRVKTNVGVPPLPLV